MPDTTPLSKKRLAPVMIIALITIHSFIMNGHFHVHPQLPVGTYLDPIVAQADPSLFQNSLYVEAVGRTQARLCIIYEAYPLIVKLFDFETVAIVLEIVSLFFILAGIFKLSIVLFNNPLVGYVAMFLYTTELNNWTLGSPAPYANFFHHGIPFAYPLIVWSMVFFFQRRYIPSLFLAGISWNFHPMCTIFLLFPYGIYWLFHRSALKLQTLLLSISAFIVSALPLLAKSFSYLGKGTPADHLWMTVVRWTAWYTCFPSTWPSLWIARAGFFLVLFIIALSYLPAKWLKKELLLFVSSVGVLCVLGTVFAEVYPIPFIIKLSLWRSTIIYLFLALPCIAYLVTAIFNQGIAKRFLVLALVVLITGYIQSFKLYYLPLLISFLLLALHEQSLTRRFPLLQRKFPLLFFASLILFLTYQAIYDHGVLRLLAFFCFTLLFLLTERYFNKIFHIKNSWVLPLVFIAMCDLGILYHRGGPEIYYHGRIQGTIDPWAGIQMHARAISDKDDIFIIPPYLNNFGIYSMRATLGDWAEGGNALYLDQQFTHEWLSRMEDIGWRKLHGSVEGYNNLSTEEVRHASKKYGVKFVITEKPKTFELKKIYENDRFILYQIS